MKALSCFPQGYQFGRSVGPSCSRLGGSSGLKNSTFVSTDQHVRGLVLKACEI